MKLKEKLYKTATIIMGVAVIICALVIVVNGLGLSDDLDFGAGAYYYTDIPGFEKIFYGDSFKTSVPVWVHIVLFLGWGWLMYRLWVYIDKKR